MSIPEKDKETFNLLVDAAHDGGLCLLECKDSVTGEVISALCIGYEYEDGSYEMVPVGQLFNFDANNRIQLPAEEEGEFVSLPVSNLN